MKPRKVLHVLNGSSGGAAMSTLGLITTLESMGVASCVVCSPAGSDYERKRLADAVHGEVEFTPLYWWNKKIRYPLLLRPAMELRQILRTGWYRHSAWRVMRAAERWGADLIHTSTFITPEGGVAARILGLPHVWHVRELIGRDKPFPLTREGRELGDYMQTHASKIIANSRVTGSLIANDIPKGMLEIVPNGIDLSRFDGADARREQRRKIVVAMVAGLGARWKKHDVFVKAAVEVNKDLPVEFRIYGHDPSEGGKKSANAYIDNCHRVIADAGAQERFHWPGYVADPRQVMSEIDILAHSADHESFGRVLVEAMASKLPIVGVNGGGVGEIVVHDKTGLLVPPDDHVAMARAIETLAVDPARRATLGEAGRERALASYSLEACARGVLGVYEAAMARPLNGA